MSDKDLIGRTAVVTGAGSGIGRATVVALAERGARVIAVGRDEGRLEATCARVRDADGESLVLAADVTDTAWLARLDALAPEVDVAVQCAMAYAPFRRLEEVPSADVAAVIETGLTAVTRLCAFLLPGMKSRRFGRLIQVGSAAASLGGMGQVVYASAKAGLVGLTRSVALEASRLGVTCNLLEPGLIDTERTEELVTPEVRKRILANCAVGRAGTPEEVARVAAFLASPESAFITGAVIPVTGGLGLGVANRWEEA